MNSKFIFTFIILEVILYSSCGVKSDPIPPASTALPSVEVQYLLPPKSLDEPLGPKSEEAKKKKKSTRKQ